MLFTRRRVGMFLYVMAGAAVIDWILIFTFRGSPAIVGLILYGELYPSSSPALPSGLILAPCPGNGFASICAPWALLLLVIFTFAVGLGLYINASRTRNLVSALGWVASLHRRWLLTNLVFVVSVLVAFAYVWGWLQYFGIVGQVPGITQIYQAVALFIHLLFVLVSIVAGRRLRRGPQAN